MLFSIIIGFRNRDVHRVKCAFESFSNQILQNFEVIFVDYGSDPIIQQKTKSLVTSFTFAKYIYSDTSGWFWNRAHALNTGIKAASGEVLILSDIDLILPANFLECLKMLPFLKRFYTFSCYYLPPEEVYLEITEKYLRSADVNYVGLCAVQRKGISKETFYREYYMDWGAEDYGFYVGLENCGYIREHLSINDFPVLHQWHPRHSATNPTPWYLAMVTYLYSGNTYDKVENSEPGLLIDNVDRTVLKQLDKPDSFKKLHLFPNPLFQFNVFLDGFFKMNSGEFGQFEYPIMAPVVIQSGRKQFVADKINCLFSKVKFPYKIESLKIVEPPIHNRDAWYDFVMYFIGENRHVIADYYIVNTDQKLVLYFQKK
ncbi:MAG: glycosyltransferase family 2 protein [Ferruginibacter sp.]